MKQLKYILIFGILIFMPNIVKAEECSVSSTVRLKKIASNISTKYDYVENLPTEGYGSVQFNLTINNVTSDIYIMEIVNDEDYYERNTTPHYGDSNKQIVIGGLAAGSSHHYVVYGNTNDICKDTLIYEFYVTLPSYNKFYTNKLCEKVPNYEYCQKWAKVTINETEFIKKINSYIKSLETNNVEEETNTKENDYENIIKIIKFLSDNSIYIFGSIILLSIVGIVILNRKDDFDLKVK